jgi:hypothetical protein
VATSARHIALALVSSIFRNENAYLTPWERKRGSGERPGAFHDTNVAEQNGCRQRLEGYLSCQQRPALPVARSEAFGQKTKRQQTTENHLAAFMSNSLPHLKRSFIRFFIAFVMVSLAQAKPPVVNHEIGKTLNLARKKDKMGIFILGTSTCSRCRGLRKYIDEGEVSITADSFVMADLNSNDSRIVTAFFEQFHLDRSAEWKIPYVVITDANGKVLVTWNGGRKAPIVDEMVQQAKDRAGKK